MSETKLTLTANEQTALVRVLEAALGEARVESRRTHFSPEYRAELLAEESLLKGLLKKIEEPSACMAG